MDDFRAIPKLNESLQRLSASGEARLAKVVGVYGNEVDVELSGGAIARYPAAETGITTGQAGVVIKAFGGSRIFIPIHRSTPIGKHHYDKGDGIQIGSIDPANISGGATSFTAIGAGASVGGVAAIAVGMDASASAVNSIAIGRDSTASTGSSIAIGYQAKGNSTYAISIGANSVSGENGLAIGRDATASWSSVAIGQSVSSSSNCVSVGLSISNTGGSNVAYGRNITITPGANWGKMAIGNHLENHYERGFIIGIGGYTGTSTNTTTKNDQGVLILNELRLQRSLGTGGHAIAMNRSDGTVVYLRVNNSNQLTIGTS